MGGRRGLRRPTTERWGMKRLRTVGRNTGEERIAILGYIEDGSSLVTKAMNGWAETPGRRDPDGARWGTPCQRENRLDIRPSARQCSQGFEGK